MIVIVADLEQTDIKTKVIGISLVIYVLNIVSISRHIKSMVLTYKLSIFNTFYNYGYERAAAYMET